MYQDNLKLTKIGWLPKEWEVKRLEQLVIIDKESLSNNTPPDYEFEYISLSDTDAGNISLSAKKIKFKDAPSRARRVVKQNDVLISTVRPNLQNFVFIKNEVNNLVASTGFSVLTAKNDFENEFGFYCLFSTSMTKQLYNLVVGSNYPAINSSDVKSLQIPLPPLAEQQKIASILRGCDAVIDKTQALINALQKRHKGLMQQLLTGKKRVLGFEKEKWKIERFGDIFERVIQKNEKNCKNVLTISAQQGLINQEDFFKKQIASDSFLHYYLLQKSDFAYNKSYSNGYPFGAFKRLDKYEEGILSPLYICFKLNKNKGDSDFWVYFFESGGMNQGVCDIAQEGARNHGLLNIGIVDFFNIEIKVPSSLAEQQKIAEILRGSEKEIQIYEKQLAALKQQKRGLMQVLLTGRVRVKSEVNSI